MLKKNFPVGLVMHHNPFVRRDKRKSRGTNNHRISMFTRQATIQQSEGHLTHSKKDTRFLQEVSGGFMMDFP